MKLVLASNNTHKLSEFREILGAYGVVSQREMGIFIEPEENGSTFEENSFLKAQAIMDVCGLPTIADDSGLMVDALDGAPGIYSARYGGDACQSDKERLELLLSNIKDVPEAKRTARFISVITMLMPNGERIVARGECEGVILTHSQGTGGFGYDPVFFYPDANCTFAQMKSEEKNRISHRAKALKLFAKKMVEDTRRYKEILDANK